MSNHNQNLWACLSPCLFTVNPESVSNKLTPLTHFVVLGAQAKPDSRVTKPGFGYAGAIARVVAVI